MWRQIVVAVVMLVGCGKGPPPAVPAAEPETVLEMARARPLSPTMQARFNIRVQSAALDIAGSTGGGVVLARPGQGRFDVFGPLGSPLYSVAANGKALGVTMTREKRHLLAENAEEAIREATSGAAGLDDVLAVLQGDLPFEGTEPVSLERGDEGAVVLELAGPSGTRVEATLDGATATPSQLVAYAPDGSIALVARYGAYEELDGELVPDEVTVQVPDLELTIDLNYRGWKVPDVPPHPHVFSVAPPEGITSEPLEQVLQKAIEGASARRE